MKKIKTEPSSTWNKLENRLKSSWWVKIWRIAIM